MRQGQGGRRRLPGAERCLLSGTGLQPLQRQAVGGPAQVGGQAEASGGDKAAAVPDEAAPQTFVEVLLLRPARLRFVLEDD